MSRLAPVLAHLRRNLVAYVALVIALSFTPLPSHAAGLITGKQIAKNAITSKHIKNNTVKSADVRDGALTGVDVANGSLTRADVAANSYQLPIRWAHVSSTGVILSQSGGVSGVTNPFTGEYLVDFGTTTAGHGVWAIISGRNNDAANGAATAASCGPGTDTYVNCSAAPNASKVHVATHNENGVKASRDFYVFLLP